MFKSSFRINKKNGWYLFNREIKFKTFENYVFNFDRIEVRN